jgi:hypothetical protein
MFELAFASVVVGFVSLKIGMRLFSEGARVRRRFHRTNPVAISEARDGAIVKIQGTVVPQSSPFEAPLSRRPCVAVEVTVERYDRKTWKELRTFTVVRDFLVADASGRALVRVGAPWFLFKHAITLTDEDERAKAFVDKHLVWRGAAAGYRPECRVIERVLMPGSPVAALGLAAREPDPDARDFRGNYREAPMRLVLGGWRTGSVAISDERV